MKSVIWLFMIGGTSHMESFDPKPALNTYAGKTVAETPLDDPAASPLTTKSLARSCPACTIRIRISIRCKSAIRNAGKAVSRSADWWPHLAECVDDLAIVRSMWTTDNNHGAQLPFHTGRHSLEGFSPRSARGLTTGWVR